MQLDPKFENILLLEFAGFGGNILRRWSTTVTSEQRVLKLEEDEGNQILEDKIANIQHEYDAAKQLFLKIPDALKEMPRMDPKGYLQFLSLTEYAIPFLLDICAGTCEIMLFVLEI